MRATRSRHSLQMKGRWESNINVWVPFMCFQKLNGYFQNRIIMFCLPVPTLIHLWEIYIFPGSRCPFFCREICGLILGIYKSLTDTWMWKLGLRPRNSQKRNTLMGFSLQCCINVSKLCCTTVHKNLLRTINKPSFVLSFLHLRTKSSPYLQKFK
jgi:hypothetical protein